MEDIHRLGMERFSFKLGLFLLCIMLMLDFCVTYQTQQYSNSIFPTQYLMLQIPKKES